MMQHMTDTVVMFWYFMIVALVAWTVAYYAKRFFKWIFSVIRSALRKKKADKE